MTTVTTRSRFQPDPVIEAFPGLLTFSGAPPDTNGTTNIAGDVDADTLLAAVNRQIHYFGPDQPPAVLVETTEGPKAERHIHVPWNWVAPVFAVGVVVGELAGKVF